MEPSRPEDRSSAEAGDPVAAPGQGDALLLVDVQHDFLPGGRLAVPDGDRVLAPIERCIARFSQLGLPVFASRDWHPPEHCSFREQGGPWPAHCVADSAGATLAVELPARARLVSKATTPDADAYSAFQDTDLAAQLARAGVRRVFVAGLATDYCVLHTVQDALAGGLDVVVLDDAIAAVDAEPHDGNRAIESMRRAGARMTPSARIAPLGPA